MRPLTFASLALLTAVAASGCAMPGQGDGGPRTYSAIGLAVVDVDLPRTDVELGEEFEAEATLVNNRDSDAADTLQVRLGDTVLASKVVELKSKAYAHVTVQFQVPTYGKHGVTFAFGEGSQDIPLRVRAPVITEVTFKAKNLDCTPKVPFTLGFTNSGDGEARDVVVSVRVVNTNDIEQSNATKTIAKVLPGKDGSASFELFAPDVCKQEDYFRVKATIAPRLTPAVAYTSDPFVL